MIVVEEHGVGRRVLPFHRGCSGSVEEIDVQPAVVVVVEKSDAGAGCVEDGGFFGRAGAMVEFVEAGLMRDVEKNDRCAVHEAAGGDGAGLCILHRSVGSACGHAGGFDRNGRLRRLRIPRHGLLLECRRGGE